MSAVEAFEPRLPEGWHEGLRERLARTRWPELGDEGWDFGLDAGYLRELCAHWADRYDPDRLTRRLDRFSNRRWEGIHFVWERAGGEGVPVVLVHGWPGGPTEFCEVIPRLLQAGHDVIVPSLPGYAFSEAPDRPLNATGIARRLRALLEEGLGYERYALQGGDWGAVVSSRIAFDSPERVAALHVNVVSVLPLPGNLADPPLSEAEQAYLAAAQRWLRREGFHLMVQGGAPDAVAVAFNDSPAGLAAWLVEKYRRWSDCDGEVERRFSKDDLCDFLTMYWATGTIGSSMRLYAAEARDRWRLAPGERIEVPAAVADFPAEIMRAPREWAERIFGDLRRWSEMPRGGHFAAFEEPELLSADLIEFLAEVGR